MSYATLGSFRNLEFNTAFFSPLKCVAPEFPTHPLLALLAKCLFPWKEVCDHDDKCLPVSFHLLEHYTSHSRVASASLILFFKCLSISNKCFVLAASACYKTKWIKLSLFIIPNFPLCNFPRDLKSIKSYWYYEIIIGIP